MGLIDTTKKALRLLIGRRFTTGSLATGQEAFTSTIDIEAADVYSEANFIPSSGLPFSGSSQSGDIFTSGSKNILKYYFRNKMTKHNIGNDVWFFLFPTGSNSGITPQIITGSQQTNFISPKYSVSGLTNATTEAATPGYNVKVLKSTSINSGSLGDDDVVSTNDYQFDYKTGVLQFDQNAPSSNEYVYVTAYQYVGKTLEEGIEFTGDVVLNSISSSLIPKNDDKHDIGSTSKQWKDLFVDGTANIDTLSLTDAFTYNDVTFNTYGDSRLSVTGSSFDLTGSVDTGLFRLFNKSGDVAFQLDDRVLVLGSIGAGETPTAVKGGLFYSGSDHFFLGFSGSGLP